MYLMIVPANNESTRLQLESLIAASSDITSATWQNLEAHICVEGKEIADTIKKQIQSITQLSDETIFTVPAMNM